MSALQNCYYGVSSSSGVSIPVMGSSWEVYIKRSEKFTNIQCVPSACGLGWVDFSFGCLPWLMGIWQKQPDTMVEQPYQILLNLGPRADGTPCFVLIFALTSVFYTQIFPPQPRLKSSLRRLFPVLTSPAASGTNTCTGMVKKACPRVAWTHHQRPEVVRMNNHAT